MWTEEGREGKKAEKKIEKKEEKVIISEIIQENFPESKKMCFQFKRSQHVCKTQDGNKGKNQVSLF